MHLASRGERSHDFVAGGGDSVTRPEPSSNYARAIAEDRASAPTGRRGRQPARTAGAARHGCRIDRDSASVVVGTTSWIKVGANDAGLVNP